MTDTKSISKHVWKNRNKWATLAFILAVLCLLADYVLLAYAYFLIFSVADVWYNRHILFPSIYRVFGAGAVAGIAFFIGKILALKYFNIQYGISPEYLNYSVTVFAWLLAGTLVLGTVILLLSLAFLLLLAILGLWQMIKNSLPIKTFAPTPMQNEIPIFIHVVSAFFVGLFLLFCTTGLDGIDKWVLWLDAYQHTDCGDNVALRQDSQHCYRFTTTRDFPWVELHRLNSQKD